MTQFETLARPSLSSTSISRSVSSTNIMLSKHMRLATYSASRSISLANVGLEDIRDRKRVVLWSPSPFRLGAKGLCVISMVYSLTYRPTFPRFTPSIDRFRLLDSAVEGLCAVRATHMHFWLRGSACQCLSPGPFLGPLNAARLPHSSI